MPSPNFLATREIGGLLRTQNQSTTYPNTLPGGLGIVELLKAKLIQGRGLTLPLSATDQLTINNDIATMLPSELVAGVRFDLNRPFGNGFDDDSNGVVDEPTSNEYSAKSEVPGSLSSLYPAATLGFDLNNDGKIDSTANSKTSDLLARYQYAKHLYILMMLLSDQTSMWAQDPVGTLVSPAQLQELTARRIAQWAINVVDFRDADSIMTPFEYDVNPFNGWSVDGILGTDSTGNTDDNGAERRLVWGVESPDLLLTESFALHDRRVDDTASDPTGKKLKEPIGITPDDDVDQIRIPEGSVFFELYCPRSGNLSMKSAYSADLYDNSGTQPMLNLGKMAPAGAATPAYPVWRIAITQSRFNAASGATNDIYTRVSQHPDFLTFDPVPSTGTATDPIHGSVFDTANAIGAAAPGAVAIERYVWFSSTDPTGNPDDTRIYYNKSNTSTLLNPGRYAVVGPRTTTYVGKNSGTNTPAAQRFDLDTSGTGTVSYTPANANPPNGTPTSYPALPIICSSALIPTGGFTNGVGVSVTEPLPTAITGYYTYPTVAGPITGPPIINDKYPAPLDQPLDKTGPLGQENLLATKMTPNYKTALLQRLANPLLAYDATTNPYITVDWQPIDLNVFSGDTTLPPSSGPPDPDDPGYTNPNTLPALGSRERGLGTVAAPLPNLWTSFPQLVPNVDATKGATAVFDYNINQSLGYINKKVGTAWGTGVLNQTPTNYGYKNAPNPTTSTSGPFPWLTWNNRPFVSNMELLQVPATSAEQLMRQFSTATATDPYYPSNNAFKSPFSHLLNFTLSWDGTPGMASYFHRLLEYVHVPSQFVGTDTVLNPTKFGGVPLLNEKEMVSFYHPPFNRVSNYRDPGRVNLNTIPGDAANVTSLNPVWAALLNGSQGPTWQQLVTARRGENTVGNNVTTLNATVPSVFMNPFRSSGGAALGLPYAGTAARPEVNVTLLRPDPTAPPPPALAPPLFAYNSANPYDNPDRNPAFRYATLNHLSNLVTTRSNVYAVWITVGYFEVTPNPGGVDTVHPDGYQLGQELGSDSGQITRHRAFYIFDRSIPVGFEPGKDHNIDRAVLLKRFIE